MEVFFLHWLASLCLLHLLLLVRLVLSGAGGALMELSVHFREDTGQRVLSIDASLPHLVPSICLSLPHGMAGPVLKHWDTF